jgi:hypothetical protein
MIGRRGLLRSVGSVPSSYRAILLGLLPATLLLLGFEAFVPNSLLADRLVVTPPTHGIDIDRYVLFISVSCIHVIICVATTFLSIESIRSRTSKVEVRHVIRDTIALPVAAITAAFVVACSGDLKIYRLSYGRVIFVLRQSDGLAYQFLPCSQHPWLKPACAGGDIYLSVLAFLLILFGIVTVISVCADIGLSSYRHSKALTPKRLAISGSEMQNDINRYATSLLMVLTSSSVAISMFQLLGTNMFAPDSADGALYQRAGLAASLFWPLCFGTIFIGVFALPAMSIMAKRAEALRLLDSSEISPADYESFFAVRQALPQSLRWMMMSGIPLAISLVPRLVTLAG